MTNAVKNTNYDFLNTISQKLSNSNSTSGLKNKNKNSNLNILVGNKKIEVKNKNIRNKSSFNNKT